MLVGRWSLTKLLEEIMSIKVAILSSNPTSYWPLDDLVGSWCHDELSLHDASVPAQGVSLAVIPFGESQAPYFDGELGSYLTIDSDPKYSHAYANALTVAAWICPLTLDNENCRKDRPVRSFRREGGPSFS